MFTKFALRAAILAAVAVTTQPALGGSVDIGVSSVGIGHIRPGGYDAGFGDAAMALSAYIEEMVAQCDAIGGDLVPTEGDAFGCVGPDDPAFEDFAQAN